MRILLLSSNAYLCLYAVQCLRGTGSELHMAGPGRVFLPRLSRFCRGFLPLDAGAMESGDDSDYRRVADYCRARRIDLVFPCGMRATKFAAAAAGRFGPARVAALAAPELLEKLDDKASFTALIQQLGLPHPETALIRSKEDLARLPFAYPIVLKPRDMHSGLGVCIADSREDAERYLAASSPLARLPLLAQERLRGHERSLFAFAKDGRVLAWTTQRIGQYGERRLFPDEPVFRLGEKVIARTGFSGLICFDIFFDEPSGTLRFLECNPRIWGPVLGSVFAGVNFPLIAVRAALGQAPPRSASDGPRTAELWRAGQIFRAALRERSLSGIARRFRNSNIREMLADPAPYAALGAVELAHAAARRIGFTGAGIERN